MQCRGVRGATTVEANTAEAILEATTELLQAMVTANAIRPEYVASVIFTTTPDLNATFPAVAARTALGWTDVALLNAHEMGVPGALSKVVRVLMHVNTDRAPHEIIHPYLRGAQQLRPDRAEPAGGWANTLEE
jgi:chorismate mutase